MFTGLIEDVGEVVEVRSGEVYIITVQSAVVPELVKKGDSVAVDGVCLTVTTISGDRVSFDAVRETVSRTTLSGFRSGTPVNLETSLTASKPLGGHFVQGHVDGTAKIAAKRELGTSAEYEFSCDDEILRLVVEKGSVAVDGVSLTVARLTESGFVVAVIPETLSATTLANKTVGDKVNIETDIIGKYVEKFVMASQKSKGVDADLLRQTGFID